jgi:hypothetical protein
MALVLKQSSSYSHAITLQLIGYDGRKERHAFKAEYKRLPQSRIDEIIKLAKAIERGKAEDEELSDKDVVREIFVGWSEVLDDKGKEVPFSASALEELMELATVPGQIINNWFKSMEVAKKGN